MHQLEDEELFCILTEDKELKVLNSVYENLQSSFQTFMYADKRFNIAFLINFWDENFQNCCSLLADLCSGHCTVPQKKTIPTP